MKKWLATITILLLIALVTVSAQDTSSTETPSEAPSRTPFPTTATPVPIDALLGLAIEPPLEITLPDSWDRVLLDTYIYRDILVDSDGALETLPIAVYNGPVSNGEGWIVMLWGFDTIVPIDTPLENFSERALWLDGLRLLQFLIFDVRCNVGTAPQREYSIGEYPALGTTFSIVDCPFDVPDTRGWFAALEVDGLNFVFYIYIDPIPPAGSQSEFELQAILDTVEFHVDELLVTRAEFEATREAYLAELIEATP
jgi:hypothetical protein